jgi:hypothetical protein
MSNLQELETKIKQLPKKEMYQLAGWLNNYIDDLWDRQIEQDLKQGKLDQIISKVEADIVAKKVRDIDDILDKT